MNYLAHAYLSFDHPEVLAGNLISDFVKGKKKFEYSRGIQDGISLHRAIDEFTDTHRSTIQAKQLFRPAYGLYAGAFMDIVYDHFLALDRNEFKTEADLAAFSHRTYGQLELFIPVFPERFARMFYYMKKQDWLFNYRLQEGIRNSFAGLVRRASYMDDHHPAVMIFEEHYAELKKSYEEFFPELKTFALQTLQHLQQPNGLQPGKN
ncbi:MAG TPA: ACP phosphodiesterase [Puia sp.]|nr:ACP phosphodiesterase [Puia sp.]